MQIGNFFFSFLVDWRRRDALEVGACARGARFLRVRHCAWQGLVAALAGGATIGLLVSDCNFDATAAALTRVL